MMEVLIIVDIIISSAQVLGGIALMNFTSSRLENPVGFKTPRANESRAARRYANKKGGKLWFIFGLITLMMSLFLPILAAKNIGSSAGTLSALVILIAEFAGFIISAFLVEMGLKHKMKED